MVDRPKKFVVVLPKGKTDASTEIHTRLERLPSVKIVQQSKSFVDLVVDPEQSIAELEGMVNDYDAELHEIPDAQLIDPLPPRKIP